MNNLKNIAGHDCAIFLFRFVLHGTGIDFVLNEEIAADMYPEVAEKLRPLAHACCETLLRYRELSVSSTIMDGNFLDTGEFEVMLSTGLGRYIPETEKQQLFQDAKRIADLLDQVMIRRTQEEKAGTYQKPHRPPRKGFLQNPQQIKKGLEQLGNEKRLQAELQWLTEGKQVRPGLRQLRPEDLPAGVSAARGYDHRGQCYTFSHKTLGDLGKIVMIKIAEGKMLVQAELYPGQEPVNSPLVKKKKKVFDQVVTTINDCFDENFPE